MEWNQGYDFRFSTPAPFALVLNNRSFASSVYLINTVSWLRDVSVMSEYYCYDKYYPIDTYDTFVTGKSSCFRSVETVSPLCFIFQLSRLAWRSTWG